MEKYINPYTDFGFKRLFGTEPNKAILIEFLNALFEAEQDPAIERHVITDLTYLPGEQLGILETDRRAVFDVYCQTASGKKIVVEMQNSYQQFYKDRVIYYSSIPIYEQGLRGRWNFELNAVYVVSIMNFSFSHSSDVEDAPKYYHTRVMLMDTREKTIFSDKLTLFFLEMKKFDKTEAQLTTQLDKWMYLLKNIDRLMALPKAISEPVFMQFMEQAEIARFTREERQRYDRSIMAYRDVENSVDTARAEGIEKGLKEGKEKGLKEGIEKGLKEGIEKGRNEGFVASIRLLMDKMQMTAEQAMDVLEIPEKVRVMYRSSQANGEKHGE